MKVISVVVKFPAGKIFRNNWGESQSAKCVLSTGEEIDVWGKPNTEICKWVKGETVMVIEEKGKYKAVDTEKPFPPTIAKAVEETKLEAAETARMIDMYAIRPPEQTVTKMIEYIDFSTKVYNHCYKMTQKNVNCDDLQPASVKDIATTIFIQTMRKFNT